MIRNKVLHIVEDLGIGGLEKVVASIAIGLNKRKYEIEVWCLTNGGDIADQLTSENIKLKILGLDSYHKPSQIRKLFTCLKKSKFDIIHSHGYFASTFARLAAVLARAPIKIAHIHTTDFSFKKRNILVEKLLSACTDKIVCVSEAVKQYTETNLRINKKKTCLIYNGCCGGNEIKSDYRIDRNKFGFSKDNVIVISVGSLVRHKGHRILIDAIRLLEKKYNKLRLLIVGDGPLHKGLNSYIREHHLTSKIILVGKKRDVFPLLKLADIFVLPSIEREGLGIALIEAMACGLPLIGSNLGGIPEVVENNVNGILITAGNSKLLAKAIERLLTQKSIRVEMGKQGKIIYDKKFSDKTMLDKIESLYDELSKKNSK
jgi:glycosyltransferase involved in cell wall biosynthesis